MSASIDVTVAGSGSSWSCTVDACQGVSPQSATATTAAAAVSAARVAAQAAVLAYAAAQGTPATAGQLAGIELLLRHACSVALVVATETAPAYGVPSTYGEDVSTFPDLDPTFAPLTGPSAVGQAVARLLFDGARGIDIRQYLGRALTAADVASLGARVELLATADERVFEAEADVTLSAGTHTLSVGLTLVLATGPFSLVVTVSSVSASPTLLTSS